MKVSGIIILALWGPIFLVLVITETVNLVQRKRKPTTPSG